MLTDGPRPAGPSGPFRNPAGSTGEAARRYVSGLLELLGDADPLAVLEEQPAWLRQALAGLDREALTRPERPGRWSRAQVVRHLADSEWVFGYRARRIVGEPGCTIEPYDQDAWAAGLRYGQADVGAGLDELEVLRRSNLLWLRTLDDEELDRSGFHAERGEESLRHLVHLMAGHDLLHRRQIERIGRAVEDDGGRGAGSGGRGDGDGWGGDGESSGDRGRAP